MKKIISIMMVFAVCFTMFLGWVHADSLIPEPVNNLIPVPVPAIPLPETPLPETPLPEIPLPTPDAPQMTVPPLTAPQTPLTPILPALPNLPSLDSTNLPIPPVLNQLQVPVVPLGKNSMIISTDRSLILAGVPNFNQVTLNISYVASESAKLQVTIPSGAAIVKDGGGTKSGNTLSWAIRTGGNGKGNVSYTLAFDKIGDKKDDLTQTIVHHSDLLSTSNKILAKAEATTTVIFAGSELEERAPYIYGFPDKSFRPNSQLTRAQGISIVVRLAFPDGAYKKGAGKQVFSDVPVDSKSSRRSHWAAKEIAKGVTEGLVSGYPDGTFRPDQPMTRGEYLLMLARALSKNPTGMIKVAFPDVKGDALQNAVSLLQELNVLNGFPDGTLRPDLSVTRAEVVVVTNKVILRFPLDNNGKASFTDVRPKDWYYGDVEAAATKDKYVRIPSAANPLTGIGKLLGQ